MNTFFTLTIINFLGVTSPGVTFVGIFNNSVIYKIRQLLPFIIGITIGDGVFIFFALIGLSDEVTQIKAIYFAIHFISGLYLGLYAYRLINQNINKIIYDIKSAIPSFKSGILLTFCNPTSLIFYLALMDSCVDSNTRMFIKIIYSIWMIFTTFCYFYIMHFIFHKLKHKILPYMKYFTRIFSIIIMFLSIKLFIKAFFLLF